METIEDALHSIYGYIERTAEPQPDGVRWLTKDYSNHMHYGASVYNGTAGIALFLADYGRTFAKPRAFELAEGALSWAETRTADDSLLMGASGVGMGWLRLSRAKGTPFTERATAIGEGLAARPPGPATDYMIGAAGEIVFLLRLWQVSGTNAFLEAARGRALWLVDEAVDKGPDGWFWAVAPGRERRYLGFGHGVAGIGYALALLQALAPDAAWLDALQGIAGTLAQWSRPNKDGIEWPTLAEPGAPVDRCQWCHGAPGIGLFFVEAWRATQREEWLDVARKAGKTTYRAGDLRKNPCQCHGLSGNGDFLLELHRATGDAAWAKRAEEFAKRILGYARETPDGCAWQADTPDQTSPDFFCGAAGAGHFLLRLRDPALLRACS